MKQTKSIGKKILSILLAIAMVLPLLGLLSTVAPVRAHAYGTYSKQHSTEYYYASDTIFVYKLGLYFSSSSNDDARNNLTKNGYTPYGHNFNAGDGHSSKYVHGGYTTTTDPTIAAKALRIDHDGDEENSKTSSINGSTCTFYKVGSGAHTITPNVMDGAVDLNKGNGGDDLKLYATPDYNAGPAITAIDMGQNGDAASAQNALTNNGYTLVTSFQNTGSAQDTNAGASDWFTDSDYNYLGYKSSCSIINSDNLRTAYNYAKYQYENGYSSASGLASALTNAENTLSDLNDGYTTRSQSTIDQYTRALYEAMPAMSLNTQYNVSINTAGMERYYRFTPSASGKYVFFTYGTSGDSRVYIYKHTSSDLLGTQVGYNDDYSHDTTNTNGSKVRTLLNSSSSGTAVGSYQSYTVIDLTGGTTYIVRANFYNSSSTGSFPLKVCKALETTFYGAGGKDSSNNSSFTVYLPVGHTINLGNTGFSRTDHTLLGWSHDSSARLRQHSRQYTANESITVPESDGYYVALWNPSNPTAVSVNTDYTASIDLEHKIQYYQFTPSETRKYVFYSKANASDPYGLMYVKTSWASSASILAYDDDSGNSHHDFVGDATGQFWFTKELTKDTVYLLGVKRYNTGTGDVPFRIEAIYNVNYNANGGSGAPAAQEKYYNKAITLSSTTPTRTGYTFQGWATSSTATSASYQPSASYSSNADAVLYAVWKANTYTVAYNGNGSTSGSTASSTHTYDTAKALTANGFTKAYTVTYNANGGTSSDTATATFNGWATSASGAKVYNNSQSVTNLSSTQGATVNLYANWTNGSVTFPTATRTGYTFSGWYTAASGGTKVGDAGTNYTPTVNTALFAQWTANRYTIKYNGNSADSGSVDDTAATYDQNVTLNANGFFRRGYDFGGWNTANDGTGADYAASATLTKPNFVTSGTKTLYAKWNEKSFSFPLIKTETDTENTASASYTSSVTLDGKTRDGYEFLYWNTSADDTGTSYTAGASVPVSDLVNADNTPKSLYAQWAKEENLIYDFGLPYEKLIAEGKPTSAGTPTSTGDVLGVAGFKGTTLGTAKTSTYSKDNGAWVSNKAIPASNVMYEETALTYTKGSKPNWELKGSSSDTQTLSSKNVFGYSDSDAYDAGNGSYSNGTYLETTVVKSTGTISDPATFTFTGKGFDLISACGTDTGILSVKLSGNGVKKTTLVDTYVKTGLLTQVPVYHVDDLAYGTYQVTVQGVYLTTAGAVKASNSAAGELTEEAKAEAVKLDILAQLDEMGLIIDDPAELELRWCDESSVLNGGEGNTISANAAANRGDGAASNGEGGRTSLKCSIDGVRIYKPLQDTATQGIYPESEQGAEYYNILDDLVSDSDHFAAFITEDGITSSITDYMATGAKSEVYLAETKAPSEGSEDTSSAQAIAFAIKDFSAGTKVMVSLRAADGSANAVINDNKQQIPVSTATEMYYDITNAIDENGVVMITNTGTGVLAVNNIKIVKGAPAKASALSMPKLHSYMTAVMNPVPEEPETEPITEPEIPTEPITEPEIPTEPITEPEIPTEPITEPEIPTEPITEPSTEPSSEPSTEPEIPAEPEETEPTEEKPPILQFIIDLFNKVKAFFKKLFK